MEQSQSEQQPWLQATIQSQQPVDAVYTIDGEELARSKAQKLCKRMFQFGFLFLPLLWLMNLWLFWPEFRAGTDPELRKYTRRSALCLSASTALFLPWFLFYVTSGDKYLNPTLYSKLDVTTLPIQQYLGI